MLPASRIVGTRHVGACQSQAAEIPDAELRVEAFDVAIDQLQIDHRRHDIAPCLELSFFGNSWVEKFVTVLTTMIASPNATETPIWRGVCPFQCTKAKFSDAEEDILSICRLFTSVQKSLQWECNIED